MTTETRIYKQIAAHFVAIFKTLAYLLQTRSRIIQLGLAMTAALALVLPMPLVYLLAAGISGFIVFMFIGLIHFRQYRGVAQGMMGVKGYQAKSRSNKKGVFETISSQVSHYGNHTTFQVEIETLATECFFAGLLLPLVYAQTIASNLTLIWR